jgi:hypothetical protein
MGPAHAVDLKRKFESDSEDSDDYERKRPRIADQNYRSPFESMQALCNLQKVDLSRCTVSPDLFDYFLRNTQSTIVCFGSSCERVLQSFPENLSIHTITAVTFTSMKVSNYILKKVLCAFASLEELEMKSCSWIECDRAFEAEVQSDLFDLTFDHCDISDAALTELICCIPKVAHLEIVECEMISSLALASVIKRIAAMITYLDLTGSTINGVDFKIAIESCTKLTYLYCNFCELTFDELMKVSFPETLIEIEYEGTKMTDVEEIEFGMKKLSLA